MYGITWFTNWGCVAWTWVLMTALDTTGAAATLMAFAGWVGRKIGMMVAPDTGCWPATCSATWVPICRGARRVGWAVISCGRPVTTAIKVVRQRVADPPTQGTWQQPARWKRNKTKKRCFRQVIQTSRSSTLVLSQLDLNRTESKEKKKKKEGIKNLYHSIHKIKMLHAFSSNRTAFR